MVAALLLLTALTLPAAPAALSPNPLHHPHHKVVLNALGEASLHAVGDNATEDLLAAAPQALPVAVVYRGPAACNGCAEAVADVLKGRYQVVFAGPKDAAVAAVLPGAKVYVQPGGGDDMGVGWNAVKDFAGVMQQWVSGGGHYVGICMGGFLAANDPGFNLLSSGADINYIEMPGADVRNMGDFLITVNWRQKPEQIYFQGGPAFQFKQGAQVQVLATYSNGAVAAAVAPYGRGSVGVTGPHPEAPQSWYDNSGFNGAREVTRLFVDLVDSTVKYGS